MTSVIIGGWCGANVDGRVTRLNIVHEAHAQFVDCSISSTLYGGPQGNGCVDHVDMVLDNVKAGLGHPANGWQTVKMTALIPPDFWVNDGYCTKTKKNKIKSRLKLISAEWQCIDGTVFTHEYLDDAIKYEATLIGEEIEGE
jgi:hypothetical protein